MASYWTPKITPTCDCHPSSKTMAELVCPHRVESWSKLAETVKPSVWPISTNSSRRWNKLWPYLLPFHPSMCIRLSSSIVSNVSALVPNKFPFVRFVCLLLSDLLCIELFENSELLWIWFQTEFVLVHQTDRCELLAKVVQTGSLRKCTAVLAVPVV